MRVMVAGPENRPLARTILGFCYFYFFLHWATGLLMFWEKLGFSYASVARYYLGDPEIFLNPRSFIGLLEVTHFHLFAMGLFFVVFSHLALYTPFRQRFKSTLTLLLAAAILGDLGAGWLVRYASPLFAWLKLASFWLLQGVSLLLLCGLAADLMRGKPKRRVPEPTAPSP